MELQLIRNATLKLRYAGTTYLIDPYFADKHSLPSYGGISKNPTVPLPVSIEDILEGVDCVLVSHLHPDHFDTKAQEILPKDIKILCQPTDIDTIQSWGFKNVEAIQERVTIGNTKIIRTDGQHGTGNILKLMGKVSGFILKSEGEKTVFWMGDTIFYSEIKDLITLHQPQIIVCHAGGNQFVKEYNVFGDYFRDDSGSVVMDRQQVIDLCTFASASTIIATHIEALDHGTTTRKGLTDFANSNGISPDRLMIPADGMKLSF